MKEDTLYQIIANDLENNGLSLFGIADLRGIQNLTDEHGGPFPQAISFAVPMNSEIMTSIKQGPNQKYAVEYTRINKKINFISSALVMSIKERGYKAKALPASERTDSENYRGDFPHKTSAIRAGLGWIGRNCQLITKRHGPWIRLGTVFTNLSIKCAEPVTKSHCGDCEACVEACPAAAIKGNLWEPGIPREMILDVYRCDQWKKENYFQFNQGHNCGICAAVCPFGK